MQSLAKPLRNDLEKTVKAARGIAESAATACLEQLGVGEANPFSHLSDEDKELRRRLRAHGRQLGDRRSAKGEQEIYHLLEEVAYEHWHRMLFARFLAENNLLMYDGVAVTLEECAELAPEEGFSNEWELAANLAGAMLPQIFRRDSVVFQLQFSPEHQKSLERLIGDLTADVFTASDSLGWVYQFWQSKRKEEVNASEVKIGARELPAVTQLFTEPYMVSFLLDNSLGAWWASRRLTAEDLRSAQDEDELRQKAAIPGVPLEYLRFVRQDDGLWMPAAGTFAAWPQHLAEFKVLDPCCGSGHFLVAAFLMLVPIRMALEGVDAQDAVKRVLTENIHGLELDKRCVELAAFALAQAAWIYPDAGGYRELPELHLACSGLGVSADKTTWTSLAPEHSKLRNALALIHDEFCNAPTLGSLLNPSKSIASNLVDIDTLAPLLTKVLAQEDALEKHEAGIIAQGIAKSVQLLGATYNLVITNVPYLARNKQSEPLKFFCDKHYPAAKNDLATVFLDRCLDLCAEGGTSCIVLPQNWLFLGSYKKFRAKLLKNDIWHLIVRLGPKAFQTPMWDFNVQLFFLSRINPNGQLDSLLRKTKNANLIRGIDVSQAREVAEKATNLLTNEIKTITQAKQLDNPDARVVLEETQQRDLLATRCKGLVGVLNGDTPRFCGQFWEVCIQAGEWAFLQSTVRENTMYGGRSGCIFWQDGAGELRKLAIELRERLHDADRRGNEAWGKNGIAISQMNNLPATLYSGQIFDSNVSVILPAEAIDILPVWCLCSSNRYSELIRTIDQKINVTNASLVKIPFNRDKWAKIAEEKYPNGLPKPYTNDPTQWIFHGHPCGSVIWDEEQKWTAHGPSRADDSVLHVAVARLLGYHWPAELDVSMELAEEQRDWVKRCKALETYVDEDGIVCIPPVRGEAPASDRLLNLLAAAYGEAWSNDILAALLKSADHAGKTLDSWLREKFFSQHCKLFQHRPFIWHIWDGLRDGFAALVNYHKLDYKNLETLTYTYLGDWITRQKQDLANGVDGAEEKFAAAEALKKSLELILEGEQPYDIFIRWKSLENQPIGWNPDLNDGVRLNIRPFMNVPDVKKKSAGILRDKPNIKWDKDRGKDVESAPWYPVFKGDRINDHHLSLAEKQAARESSK